VKLRTHKIIAFTHRVEEDFKYDVISLEQYYSIKPENLDYRFAINAFLQMENRHEVENKLNALFLNAFCN
jgi:hypothetical protein